MAIDIIARGMIEDSNGNISQLSEKVSNHTDNSDIHVTVSDKENWNSHPNDVMASGNPVTLDGLQEGVPFSEMVVSGKNLMPFPYYETTKTVNGITFTDNGDGTITANGTATAIASFALIWKNIRLPKGTYTISGCPKGGNVNTGFYIVCGTDSIRFTTDTGNGGTFGIENDINDFTFSLRINSGVTIENLIFRPQLELGSTPTEYEPPITGRELQVNVSGKNLLQKMTDKTIGGLHYSPNDDGSVSVTGTQTAENYPGITSTSGMLLKAGNYTLSGGTERLQITALDIDANTVIARAKIAPATFSIDTDKYIRIYIFSAGTYNSQTFDDVIYPQLEIGDTATAYEPYHGSTTTITPDSNPYVIPNDIRQQDGLNVVSVSEGEISVTGVRKNAAVKKIWDKLDELTTAIIVSNGETIE